MPSSFMNRKFIRDISASSLQVVINQLLGLLVFLLTSIYLSKEVYGEFNWSIAVLTFATTVLSFRLEQIVVKKTAAGEDSSRIMTLFLLHVLLTGAGLYALLLVSSMIFPGFFAIHDLLLLVGISQVTSYFSSPFKQAANGKERFDYLAVMSSAANLVRSAGLCVLLLFSHITIKWVLLLFIASSVFELLVSYYLVTRSMKIPLNYRVRFKDYLLLLKESLPQLGAALLMAGITRIDWILLGIFATTGITAEYSFAYRVYELSPFPLLIIAPVLLSRFSRLLANDQKETFEEKKKEIGLLVRGEMIAATLIPLVLNICWVPLIDYITHNKYGASNKWIFLVLSCCIPFQYISNLLWSYSFAQHQLKQIFRITLVTFCVVVVGDFVMIPVYGAKGAAGVYLAAIIIEYLNYMRSSPLHTIKELWQSLLTCFLAAWLSGFSGFYLLENTFARLAFSIPLFFLLLMATRQLRKSDIAYVLQLVKKHKK